MASHCRLRVTTGLDPVVHADVTPASAGGSATTSVRFGLDCRVKPGNDERNERNEKKIRRRNADRRNGEYAVPNGRGRAPIGVRTTVGVPPRFLPKGLSSPKASAPGQACWTRQERSVRYARPPGAHLAQLKRALPRPRLSQSSDSTSRAGHSAGRLMPDAARERVAKPPAGTAYFAPLLVMPARPRPIWARFDCL